MDDQLLRHQKDRLLVLEAISVLFLFIGFWGTYFLIQKRSFVYFSLIMYLIGLLLLLIRKKLPIKEEIFPLYFSFTSGILLGSYFLDFKLDVKETSLLALGLVLTYFVINFLIKYMPKKIFSLAIVYAIIIFGIIFSSINISKIVFRELLVLIIYALPMVTLSFFLLKRKQGSMLLICCSFCFSYFLLFIYVMLQQI